MLTLVRTAVAIGTVAAVLTLARPLLDVPAQAGDCLARQLDVATAAGGPRGDATCHRDLQGRLVDLVGTLSPRT